MLDDIDKTNHKAQIKDSTLKQLKDVFISLLFLGGYLAVLGFIIWPLVVLVDMFLWPSVLLAALLSYICYQFLKKLRPNGDWGQISIILGIVFFSVFCTCYLLMIKRIGLSEYTRIYLESLPLRDYP